MTDKVLKSGDSVTKGGVTTTLVDEVGTGNVTSTTAAGITKIGSVTLAAGDTITSSDGTVYTYHAGSTTNKIAGFYKDGDWADTAAAATKAKTTLSAGDSFYSTTKGTSYAVVDELADGTKSTIDAGLADFKASTVAGGALAAGDSVTSGGKTVTAVGTAFVPTAFDDVKKGIQAAAAATKVTISNVKGNASKEYTIVENSNEEDASANKLTRENIIAKIKEGDQVTIGTAKYTAAGVDAVKENTITIDEAYKKIAKELEKASSIGADAGSEAKVLNKGDGSFEIAKGSVEIKNGLSFSLHVGADADMTNKINVNIDTMSAAGLGIKGISVAGEDGSSATYAIDAIADAVAKVSSQRSALGAVQNRLEHTIANLDNVVENTTSAESRIRDTDMAEEMVTYSKNSILQQAGQSMLAQANQANQGVLSLLQ